MCDSHPVPKVFISLRLLLFRYESHIQNQTFPSFSYSFTLKRKTHPVHSETKDTSYTPTIPFLSFKIIHVEAEKYPFWQWFIPFRLFYCCPNMCWKPKLYPSCSLSFTLKRKTHLLTWYYFLFICLFFVYLIFKKYNKLSATFLLLLLLLFLLHLSFRDERNMSMLTQNILP